MKIDEKLFMALQERKNWVSGQDLAQELQLSHTAIGKAIQALENRGLTIETVPKKGYRLTSGDLLVPDWISQQTGLTISHQTSSASTQLDARAGMDQGRPVPHLYLADQQTQARGRFGRQFFTSPTGGIYMSLHLQPNQPAQDLPAYTLMVAASLILAIRELTGITCQIKWVNDIYLGRQKIAGILTEAMTAVETGLVTDVIIGVGINFAIADFPEDLADKAGSLFWASQPTISRQELIARLWQIFFQKTEQELFNTYEANSLVLNQEVTFRQNGQDYTGLATGLTPTGQLLVTLADGQEKILHSGEISLSSWSSPPAPDQYDPPHRPDRGCAPAKSPRKN